VTLSFLHHRIYERIKRRIDMKEFHEECVICGEMQEFDGLDELQEAIIAGEVGEYICPVCVENGRDVIFHD
jgi:hypothetical protein